MERRIRGGNISVVVRARPLSRYEEARGLSECIEVDADGKRLVVLDPDDKMGGLDYLRLDRSRSTTYAFDRALGPEVTQSQTFDASSSGLVGSILAGHNACCFAYGATGSGKTFTMTGSDEQPGLVTRTLVRVRARVRVRVRVSLTLSLSFGQAMPLGLRVRVRVRVRVSLTLTLTLP